MRPKFEVTQFFNNALIDFGHLSMQHSFWNLGWTTCESRKYSFKFSISFNSFDFKRPPNALFSLLSYAAKFTSVLADGTLGVLYSLDNTYEMQV